MYIFVMQGLFSLVVGASALHVLKYSEKDQKFGIWEQVGSAVFVVGFLMEVISDAQLQAHRDDPARKGTIITTGFWRYSRHPNYFAESLLWWGIYLIACGTKAPDGYYTWYSAFFITFLVRFVSGVRLLEKKQKRKAAFRVYMRETNVFVPWRYKTLTG